MNRLKSSKSNEFATTATTSVFFVFFTIFVVQFIVQQPKAQLELEMMIIIAIMHLHSHVRDSSWSHHPQVLAFDTQQQPQEHHSHRTNHIARKSGGHFLYLLAVAVVVVRLPRS